MYAENTRNARADFLCVRFVEGRNQITAARAAQFWRRPLSAFSRLTQNTRSK